MNNTKLYSFYQIFLTFINFFAIGCILGNYFLLFLISGTG